MAASTGKRQSGWTFRRRFRRNAFGWRSQPAVKRVNEAVREIRGVRKRDPVTAAEGAVDFLERVAPALEHVDSSSGAIGNAVNRAIEQLVPIIRDAPASAEQRDAWMQRLWRALEADEMPYIERLGDYWGELCAEPERAQRWAQWLYPRAKRALGREPPERFFVGTIPCLACLLAAGDNETVVELLEHDRLAFWPFRRFGVMALAAAGRVDEALAYAESGSKLSTPFGDRAALCESILLEAGRRDEAYRRFALEAATGNTRLQRFRSIARKYPERDPEGILADLVASTPGEEGKWFATARSLGHYDLALDLARQSPTDPKTLVRAARDHCESEPGFARGAALLALAWLAEGYGYDITADHVEDSAYYALYAGGQHGSLASTQTALEELIASNATDVFVRRTVGRWLETQAPASLW